MLQTILNLNGIEQLSKQDQKNLVGGIRIRPSLCIYPLEICSGDRTYDPCAPITSRNYPC